MAKLLLEFFSYKKAQDVILHRPVWVIIAIAVITLFFAWHIPRLSFKTSIYDLVIEDIPETTRYEDFKEVFGSEEIIRVVIKCKNIFDSVTFRKIEQLTHTASKIDGVRRVISLPGIKKAVDTSGKWSLEEFAGIMAEVDMFQRNLFSADHKTTALTIVLQNNANQEVVIKAINEIIAGAPKELNLYQIGMPLVSQALAGLTEKDFFRLPPITFLLITIILFCIFRKFKYLLLPISCITLVLTWTFGLMALSQIPLSMLTMIVPVFLIAVGTAYCLHIVSEYIFSIQRADSPEHAVLETFSKTTFPTILAVATTVIGLGSLLVNRITAIREFAVFSCFGMFSLLVIFLTFLPSVMSLLPLPDRKKGAFFEHTHLLDRVLDWIVRLNLNYQRITLPAIGVIVIICLIGIFRIRVETNPVGYFKEDIPVSRNFHDIYKHLSGSFPINVTMGSENEDYFEDPQHVADIARVQKFMETLSGVDKTVSFADYMKLVNYASNRFEPEYYALPKEPFEMRILINNYKSMLGEDMFSRFMNPDFSKTNILLLTHNSSSNDFLNTRKTIFKHVQQFFSKDLQWDVTGLGMVISESSHQLTSGQVKSLSITMVLVFGIMFLLFLSSKVGLIAVVPNLFPIIINFGIMGWIGIELSMFTSLIASIAIGLAVDDTIHYLVRYNREFKKDLNDKRAIKETLRHIGRPIIYTTLTISIGFSILSFSSFKPTALFGTMMVITMFSALVGDLILLPSLMQHVELVTLWDLMRLKLGKEPRYGIPLFKGLSRNQVNYILMAGSLKTMDAEEVLFRKGDSSDSMYAVISGTMNVIEHFTGEDITKMHGNQKLLNTLEVGDIVGEMGLLRSIRRSATVISTKPVELLQINRKMFKRLQWLYPPVAQRFFFNLMTIICDRLEKSTQCLFMESLVDDLTGMWNHKGFLMILEVQAHQARRYNSDLALCLIRVDFETTNPQLGYDAADRIFRSIGQILSREIRGGDALGRIDSQTFALLMPQTSFKKGKILCNRLKPLLKEKHFKDQGARIKITLGLAELKHEADEKDTEFLARAEESLKNAWKH